MSEEYAGKERRQFFRYNYDSPIKYKLIDPVSDKAISADTIKAMSKNLSISGILFVVPADKTPELSSLVVLFLDLRTANICKEIENLALMVDNKLIGRVMRLEDNGDGTMGVGVAFVKKTDPLSKDVEKLRSILA